MLAMFKWFMRVLAALVMGYIGAATVPFLSIEVYRLLLRLGADNYQILIRLSNRFQTPAEFFTQETILFGAILGVSSGYMLAMQHEQKPQKVWMLSKICSVFAALLLYSILVHPIYVVLGKEERANAIPVMFTSFLVPAICSLFLFIWGYKVYGAQDLAAKKWDKRQIRAGLVWFFAVMLINAVVD
jgi:hypothetical protein